ncbi:MAG TPA: glycosyltransferase family 4 protein [Blastocatellia bacterium]|nr:glycosyltransferase family 4 protein [Blastocatellia bacterium]
MKVGIYNEPGGGIGGSEISVAVLAEALSGRHQVEIVHHKPYMNLERLSEVSETDLSRVRMRYVAAEPYSFGSAREPWRRYREARGWQAGLSKPYDLFINFTHGYPPFCHAPRGALIVLFPLHERPHMEVKGEGSAGGSTGGRLPPAHRLKNLYHEWEWRKRISTYQVRTTISRFSQAWTKRRWGFDCEIVSPPADTRFEPCVKTDSILSVGRFAATGHSKKQLEMVAAFGELQSGAPSGWEYFCVGGLGDADADLRYFQSVSRRASDCRATVLANVERSRLKQLYGQARIFWHAAGYGESDQRPELSEHFGIATVEAMSAGCVPVAIDKGGQPEIVRHGESGFVWSRLEELKEYTELLMRDERLRSQMAEAARARAALFSRDLFVKRFLSAIEPDG